MLKLVGEQAGEQEALAHQRTPAAAELAGALGVAQQLDDRLALVDR